MTLVQNLRLLSSGNRILCFLALILLGTSSCEMFRKAQTDDKVAEDRTELDEVQGSGTYNPETGEYEPSTTVSSEVDTVKWTVDPDQIPPITSDATEIAYPDGNTDGPFGGKSEGSSEKLGTYNIAVLLPFFGNRYNTSGTIDKASLQALNFYGGMKIAFEELQRQGVDINATVHDTKGSETVTQALMNSAEVTNSDLIIGPFRKNNIKVAGQKAKDLQVPFVSPLSASSGVAKDNPYFIQVSPYLQTHCQAITQHARKRFKPEQIVLIARNKKAEISRFNYFQDENKKIEGSDEAERFQEYIVTGEEMNFDEIDVTPYLSEGDTTVFIVPSFSSRNFIYGLLLQIYNTKGNSPIVIYGMPQWMSFEPPSFDYYELLNLHVSSANFVDGQTNAVKDFQRKFYNRFGTLPDDKAYSGYDVTMYFGKMIEKHGTRFQEKIDVERDEYLNTKFEFVREVPLSAALQEDFTQTNLYENKHVYILKFQDYQFKNAE